MRFIASAAIASLCMTVQAQTLPVFPANNVPETFFGTVVEDPYRALENDKDPAVSAWMKAQAEHAHRSLEGLKGYAPLKARIGAPIDGARYASVSWFPDGKSFFYTRGPVLTAGMPMSEALKNRRSYYHVVGSDAETDVFVAGPDGNPRIPVLPTQSAYVFATPGSKFAIALIVDGVQREYRLYSAPMVVAAKADAPWCCPSACSISCVFM